ncbi:hypothetical protein [Spirillospora albida]|uniref:hypothetical protein n=1 Tax=Spirillospora albida TaxID=58123 RepID=UPI0004C10566|nr:hypothetical protein [Spirillospora albida]
MTAQDSTARTSRRRTAARRLTAVVLAAGIAAALPPAPGIAARVPAEPKDLAKEYAKLQKRAAALSKEYRGELLSLEKAKKEAEQAGVAAARASRDYEVARADIARLASSSYMTGRLDMMPLLAGPTGSGIRDATVIEHLSRNNGRRVTGLRELSERTARSQREARTKLDAVKREVEDLESQRTRVRKLLAKYKPETPTEKAPTGGRPDGVNGTKSPIIGNSMTARMRTVLLAVDGRFGAFPAIGCARPGDPQDHGSGRACDFMESSGGAMPSASARSHGDAVAQYLIGNASRFGLKYIIWRQRIYDFRGSGGWKMMEDRGSVTQNHYDHVHVSVL